MNNAVLEANRETVKLPPLIPKTNKQAKTVKKSNFIKDFIISGFAASIAKTIIAPLERIKLIMQNQHIIDTVEIKYSSSIKCASDVIKTEGFISLWRGNVTNLLRYLPNQAFNFAFKDTFKKMFKNYDQKKEFLKFFLANSVSGGLAGAVSLFIVYPLDIVRTRLATDNMSKDGMRSFKGTIDCARKIIQGEGVKAMYKGYTVAMIGIALYRAFYFGVYDSIKGWLIKPSTKGYIKFIYAQLITNGSSLCFYPLDTIRRRLMLQAGKSSDKKNYTSTYDCAIKIKQQEGYVGYYRGFGANIVRGSGAALVLVLYDNLQEALGLEKRGLGGS